MADLSRRHFLQGATGASMLSLAGLTGCAGAGHKMTMELACGSIGVKATQAEAIDLAHRYGFGSVAVNANELADLSDAQLGELLAELKAKNLVWGAASMPGGFNDPDEEWAVAMAQMPAFAKTLQRAGVTRVRKWISPGHDTLPYTENFKIHSQRIAAVAAVLSDHGQRIGLEYVGPMTSRSKRPYEFVYHLKQTLELIANAGKDNVGIVADSWHWYTSEETAADLLQLTNKDVVSADLNDAPAGIPVDEQIDSTRDLPMATGVIDMKAFMNALKTIGYDGPARAEPFKAELKDMPAEKAVAMTADAMKKAFALIE